MGMIERLLAPGKKAAADYALGRAEAAGPAHLAKYMERVAKKSGEEALDAGRYIKKGTFVNKMTPSVTNLMTGYKLTGTGKLALAGGIVGGTMAVSSVQGTADKFGLTENAAMRQMGRVASSGSIPAYSVPQRGRHDLGATGDLVFALNAQRRG